MALIPFIFILLLIPTYCYKIGFIYNDGSASESQQFEIFSKYIAKKDNTIVINDFKYDGAIDKFITIIGEIIKDNKADVIFTNCTDEILRMDMEPIVNNSKLLWCTNSYNYGVCNHNIVSGNSIVSPLKESILFL